MGTEEIKIKPFDFSTMPLSCTWISIGAPGSGKTTLTENICYYKKHQYPVARVFICNEGGYKRMCSIFPPIYVSNYYNEDEEKSAILRQKKCSLSNTSDYTGNYMINIADDLDQKFLRTPLMISMFKVGTQHWNELTIIGTQYAVDFAPEIRTSVSYVALFRCVDEIEKKKLYNNFGGVCGPYEKFCALLSQITGDHRCMIIKKMSQSNNLEDNVFWYETKPLGKWMFGCKEYRDWNKERYNTNYCEKVEV